MSFIEIIRSYEKSHSLYVLFIRMNTIYETGLLMDRCRVRSSSFRKWCPGASRPDRPSERVPALTARWTRMRPNHPIIHLSSSRLRRYWILHRRFSRQPISCHSSSRSNSTWMSASSRSRTSNCSHLWRRLRQMGIVAKAWAQLLSRAPTSVFSIKR